MTRKLENDAYSNESNMVKFANLENIYLKSVSILLLITGATKLVSASQKVSVLVMSDPLIGFLSVRQMSIVAGIIEMAVAFYIFTPQNVIRQLESIAWLSILFITYHIGLNLIGFHGMCKCLGNANGWLGLSDNSINMAVKCMLGYFSIGSLLMLGFKRYLLTEIKKKA
jgi:hypothetical protein